MAFECFDVAILVEDVKFLGPTGLEPLKLDGEPTLDQALKQVGRIEASGTLPRDIRFDDDARREATLDHLWFRNPTGAGDTDSRPGDGAYGGFDVTPADPGAPENGVLILRDLSSEEKKLVAGGQGTTDEYWGDEEGEYDDGVVVIGPEDDYWNPFDDNPVDQPDNDSNPDGDWSGQGGPDESDPSPNPYLARVTIDDSVPPEARERAEQVREKLAAGLREVGEKINSLADDQLYRYGNREVTGAEMKAEFAKIGFNITWGRDYGPNGNGANENGVVSANLPFLEGIVAQSYDWGNWGPNWLILHELAHLLGVLEAFLNGRWAEYLASDPTPTNEEFQLTSGFWANENLANWFTYMLGQELDLPTGPYPPSGYDPSLGGSGDAPTGGSGGPGPGGYVLEN